MFHADKPELLIGVLAVAGVGMLFLWRLLAWVRNAPVSPNPWDEATEAAVQSDDAVPVCYHCLTPAPPTQWFCETCGCAVGPYNNLMPYVHVFSEGEVLRNAVTSRVRLNANTIVGYLLMSLIEYLIFAPIYWYFLFKNLRRTRPHGEGVMQEA